MDPLALLFGSVTKARVLDTLLSRAGESFHLRGLAQAAGTDPGNTSKLLKTLVDSGIVLALPEQPSTRYSINLRSPLVPALRQLVACAGALVSDLRGVASGLDAEYVGIYGSMATGTDVADSDVDVLLVGEMGAVAAQAAFKALGRKHHKVINVVAVRAAQLPDRLQSGAAFWVSVATNPRIDLKGDWHDVAQREATAG